MDTATLSPPRTDESLSLQEAKETFAQVTRNLDGKLVRAIQENPRPVADDSSLIARAKLLARRVLELESGIRFEDDGSLYFRV